MALVLFVNIIIIRLVIYLLCQVSFNILFLLHFLSLLSLTKGIKEKTGNYSCTLNNTHNPVQNTKHAHYNFRCYERRSTNTKQATKNPRKLAKLSIRRRRVSAGQRVNCQTRTVAGHTAGALSISTLQYASRVHISQTASRSRANNFIVYLR